MAPDRSSATACERVPLSAWLVLGVVSIPTFMAFLDATIVNIAFPAIEADLSSSRSTLSWILDGYAVMVAAFVVPAGRYADALGVRRTLYTGIALFTLASAGCALAPDTGALIAARVVQGLGAAIIAPAAFALVLREFPASRRSLGMALLVAPAGIASALGPVVGGALVDTAGWRWIFWINVPIGMLALIAGALVLREARTPAARRPDLPGAVLLAAALALLATALMKGESWGWTHPQTLAVAALGVAVGAIALRRTARHPAPALELELLRLPLVGVANAATAMFAMGFFGLLIVQSLFLTTVWGYSALDAGLAIAPAPAIAAMVAGPAARWADAHGFRALAVAGAIAFLAGAAFLALAAGADPNFAEAWLPGTILLGVGTGVAMPAHMAAASSALPPECYGQGSALNSAARQFGAVLGFTLAVVLVGTPGPAEVSAAFDRGFLLGGVAAALAGALGLRLHAAATPLDEESVQATTARELEVSPAEIGGGAAVRFLRDCGVSDADLGEVLRSACDVARVAGRALLRVRDAGARAAIEVLPGHVPAARSGRFVPDVTAPTPSGAPPVPQP